MWPFETKTTTPAAKVSSSAPIFFTNTLTRKKEHFIPIKPGFVSIYTCGPTVYSQAHIGNLRPYIVSDLIARTLTFAGYHVRRVINITDVGHLVSDADEGEDKMELSAQREGIPAEEIATRYTSLFMHDIKEENIDVETILFPRATQYIKEQIAMVQTLEKKGYTYRTHDGIYFDTSKFPDYGKLGGVSEAELKSGDAATLDDRITIAAGRRIAENKEKRQPADFALWKFSPLTSKRQQEWPSPWGLGFPGWHIECSAMVRALLGDTIDIHTGGIDHIPVHHNNEIAQSECVLDHPFVHYWIHNAFLTMKDERIGKSVGNVVYLSDITAKDMHPLALRYFFLQAHYRSTLSFSWEALEAANTALNKLWRLCATIALEAKGVSVTTEEQSHLVALLRDDLGTPQALAYLWDCVRDEDLLPKEQLGIIEAADAVLGISLTSIPESAKQRSLDELPIDIQALVKEREKARVAHDFEKADAVRMKLQNRGYRVDDGPNGPSLTLLVK